MNIPMPDAVARYFAAGDEVDAARVSHGFTADAVVLDEKRRHVGQDAIRAWIEDTRRKYAFRAEPLAASRDGSRVAVTARVTGNFPGSPIQLEFVFAMRDERIASLEIR